MKRVRPTEVVSLLKTTMSDGAKAGFEPGQPCCRHCALQFHVVIAVKGMPPLCFPILLNGTERSPPGSPLFH